MRPLALAIVVAIPLMMNSILRAADSGVTLRRRDDSPVAAYQRVELEVGLDRNYSNPFDPDEIAVDAQNRVAGWEDDLAAGVLGEGFSGCV